MFNEITEIQLKVATPMSEMAVVPSDVRYIFLRGTFLIRPDKVTEDKRRTHPMIIAE